MTDIKLERSEAEQDLRVFIEKDLSFDKHISGKVNKANSIAGLIRRSFEYIDCDSFKFRHLFTVLVRPHLEYAQATWSPFLKKAHLGHRKMYKDQRASKQVLSLKELGYEDRLRTLKLPTLVYRG